MTTLLVPGSEEWTEKHWGPHCTRKHVTVDIAHHSLPFAAGSQKAWRHLDLVFQRQAPHYRNHVAQRQDIGSFNCRFIAGTNIYSNHAFATALDIAWLENTRDPNPFDNPIWTEAGAFIRHIEHRGFRWGGRFSHPDSMHVELMLVPWQVRTYFLHDGELSEKGHQRLKTRGSLQ